MSNAIWLIPDTLRSLPFGSIGAAYMGIGTSCTTKPRLIYIANLTDVTLMFSFDGINDHFPMVLCSFILFDICENRTSSEYFSGEIGDRLYVKNLDALVSPSKGSVNVTIFYGKDD